MATIKAVVLSRTDKEGMSKIQIAVCHHQQTAYIPTDMKVNPKDFIGGYVKRGKNAQSYNGKITSLINQFTETMNGIEDVECLNVQQLKSRLTNNGNDATIKTVGDAFDRYMESLTHPQSKRLVNNAKTAFLTFCKGKDITIKSLDNGTCDKYIQWLKDEAKNTRTGKPYAAIYQKHMYDRLRSAIGYCHKKGILDKNIDPHTTDKITIKAIRDNSISVDTFIRLRDMELKGGDEIGRDMFLLSFYLGGMNFADMKKIDFRKDKITYIRQKTAKYGNTTTIPILPQARAILDKYMDSATGLLKSPHKRYKNLYNVTECFFCRNVSKSFDENITFYSARKCFAQVGMNIGIGDTIIDYILGHSPMKRGVIAHYSSVMPELAEEAMKMVFEFVDKPEDIKAIFRRNILKQLHG